ncbi:MAG: pyridoxal phosphate-dependent aminotransferase [Thermosphaera sp.]
MNVSARVKNLEQNPQRLLIAKADELARKGLKVYNYTAGQPGLPPDKKALEFFIEKLKEDPFKHFRYIPTQGLFELRQALSNDLRKYGGVEVSPDEILIVSGGADGLVLSIFTTTDPGDEILLLEPCYSVYWDLAKFAGLKVQSCPQSYEKGFSPDPECIKEKITSKTKAILFASPDNPTSRIINEEVAKTISEIAVEKKIWVIYDVAYKHIVYEGKHVWLEKYLPLDNLVVVGSFSKDIAIPGGRLGYIYTSREVVKELVKLKGALGIVAPVPSQWLAYYYLEMGFKEEYLRNVLPVYMRRRDVAYSALVKYLPEARVQKPVASMYLFPDITAYLEKLNLDDFRFAMKIADEKSVITLPGSIFGPSGKGHLRITFVTMNEQDLEKGIKLMAEWIETHV